MADFVEAPFDPAQVESLNAFQTCDLFLPFTCGNAACREVLVAIKSGWICPKCDYIQNWAHGFMAEGSSATPRIL